MSRRMQVQVHWLGCLAWALVVFALVVLVSVAPEVIGWIEHTLAGAP